MAYYLGIDGGGTKTTCSVGDDSVLIATVTAGPSNIVRVGEAEARESIHQCVRQACAGAGITPAQIARTCVGAAGAARPEIAGKLRSVLAEILPGPIEVVGDMQIALEAAFGTGPGVIIIAGTGSIAYGRDQMGTTARAGGWGFAISDEGSAHWIGRAAISAVLRATDEQENSSHAESGNSDELANALMKAWGEGSVNDLASAANSTPPPDFAALFPVVLAVADADDELARKVLTMAGVELARIGDIAICRLFPVGSRSSPGQGTSLGSNESVPLAMAGGVFRHAALVREVFYNEIRRSQPRVTLIQQVIDPVEGALRLARQLP